MGAYLQFWLDYRYVDHADAIGIAPNDDTPIASTFLIGITNGMNLGVASLNESMVYPPYFAWKGQV